jgi:hypothetical protein
MRTIGISLLVAFLFSGCDIVEKDPVPAKLVRNVLNADRYQVPQNGAVEFDVLANDTIKGGFTLKMGTPLLGKLTHTQGFKYNYEPAAGYVGTDTVSYEVIIDGATLKSEVVITVQRNCLITAVTDTVLINEGTSVTFDPLANDINCSSTLTPTYGNYSENGLSVNASPNGHLQVSVAVGYFATKSVTYTICNNFNECTTGTIVFKVIPNQACATTLKANPDTYTTDVNSPLLLPYDRVLLNDNYCLNDISDNEIEIIGNTQFGTLIKFANYFVYTPNLNFPASTERLEYRIRSRRFPNITATATLNINVQ